jgi:peroxiredoxin
MVDTELEVGSSAPEFKLTSNNGKEIMLSDYNGRKLVLFFCA